MLRSVKTRKMLAIDTPITAAKAKKVARAVAVVIRSMLGVSPSAYQEACEIMGPENAAVAMACIFERANLINSAGGYLRDLTRRTEQAEFSLGPMIMALLKANAGGHLKTG